MSPLLQQIAIGAGALVVGFLIGVLTNLARVRRARRSGEATAERLQAELAVQRVQITDLKSRVASFKEASGPWVAELEAEPERGVEDARGAEDVTPLAPAAPGRPNRLAQSRDRSTDSARSRA